MPKIDFTREEVRAQLGKYRKVRDCIAGQEKVKEARTLYLPAPNPSDTSQENKDRYEAYLTRANFLDATDSTVQGLLGQVFNADPVVELPESMKLIEEDADGAGMTLTQRAKKTLAETLAIGRTGLLVDFPKAPLEATDDPEEPARERDFSRAELQDGTARANILQFNAENVINWRTTMRGGKTVLSLVVIACKYIAYDDGFEIKEDDEWRVLKLEGDTYVCEVWRLGADPTAPSGTAPNTAAKTFILHDRYTPRDATGKPLDHIPFTFVGSLNNNESPDKPPMLGIANLNLAHYRNSADYEDNVYMLGQGTPVAVGLTSQWVKDVWKDQTLQLGSRGIVPLPVNGDFKIVASEENGMVLEAMNQKERQMAMLGAQLVESKEVQRTLGEAKMEKAMVDSVLVQCAKNTAAAIQQCLRWAAAFYGENPDTITYDLSTDFAILKLTPEERKALIAEYQGGLLTFEEARNGLRQSGIAYLDDKKAQADIDAEADKRLEQAVAEAGGIHEATGGNDEPTE